MRLLALVVITSTSLAGCEQRAESDKAPVLATGGATATGSTVAGEVAELGASANRKMLHDDGKGCLEDLDRIKARAPKLAKTMTALRAQCQMLNGQCQAGKKLLADYYVRAMNMAPERAHATAESIGSMRCRGPELTERDQLLRALWEISDGAFVNSRKDCEKNIGLVRELATRVPPKGPDDTQIKGGPRALYHNGAACLARAKDCAGAWRAWQANYPGDALSKLNETQRREIMESGFRSSIDRCKEQLLTTGKGVKPVAPPAGSPAPTRDPLNTRK